VWGIILKYTLKEIYGVPKWIQVAQGRIHWQAAVIIAMNVRVQ